MAVPHEQLVVKNSAEAVEGSTDGWLAEPDALPRTRNVAFRHHRVKDTKQIEIEGR